MSMQDLPSAARFADAATALALLAIDPAGLGGAVVRAPAGVVRDRWLDGLIARLPPGAPVRRIPAGIAPSRLIGGLDLAATLAAGRPIGERGLLAAADGGLVVLAMAERASAATISSLTGALDTGNIACERDGLSMAAAARFAVVALDEGVDDDERASAKLADRLAFQIDLSSVGPRDADALLPDPSAIIAARGRLTRVQVADDIVEALAAAAIALGVGSVRPVLAAVKAGRAAAALEGRTCVDAEDAALAARLVLGPRATRLPPMADDNDEAVEPPPPDDSRNDETEPDTQPPDPSGQPLADRLLDAAKATIPAGLLASLAAAARTTSSPRTEGRKGAERTAPRGGRPAGSRRGDLSRGGRLDVIETLRAAAPWQVLRRREAARGGRPAPARHVEVRRADFHIHRHKRRCETATIFVVDASGSSALNRLAEAKGAVELLLADCYIRRDEVAVIAFRGKGAELLLAPTRSLVRAKRALAGLPGGGTTPLASAIEAATALADLVRRKGQTPTLVLLTDGRANICRDGTQGRGPAEADARAAAQAVRGLAITAVLIDTSPKPQREAEQLAAEMAALYLPLPHADARKLSQAVRASMPVKGTMERARHG